MGSSESKFPVQSLSFLTIGAFPRASAEGVVARVSRRVAVPCRFLTSPFAGEQPFLPERQQIDADALLEKLEEREAEEGNILVGLTLQDLGVRIFTFVFGRARRNGSTALVSLTRLRQEFYGLPPDPELTFRRTVAEVLHEVGHVTGLPHCIDLGCLMHFANNVESIDLRGDRFCRTCTAALPIGLIVSSG